MEWNDYDLENYNEKDSKTEREYLDNENYEFELIEHYEMI